MTFLIKKQKDKQGLCRIQSLVEQLIWLFFLLFENKARMKKETKSEKKIEDKASDASCAEESWKMRLTVVSRHWSGSSMNECKMSAEKCVKVSSRWS